MVPFCVVFLLVRACLEARNPAGFTCVAVGAAFAWFVRVSLPSSPRARLLRDAACGAGLALALPGPAADEPPSWTAGGPTVVEGVVTGTALERPDGIRFRLSGGLDVRVENSRAAPWPGDRIRAVGVPSTSGRSILCKAPEAVETIVPCAPSHPERLLETVRRRLRDRIRDGVRPETGDFLCALVLGDRSLDRDVRDDCARAGILHLVAVSGSHLGFVAAGLAVVVRAPAHWRRCSPSTPR
jgi:hypothetical protein